MTTAPLYGGTLKRDLIKRAFGLCGQSVTEYELTPEEYSLGLQIANDLAATLGSGFGWYFPDYGTGSPEDESGILAGDNLGFIVMLAQDVAMNIGKQYQPNAVQETAKSGLVARYQVIPFRTLGRDTPRGQGNRYWQRYDPFFITEISADETAQ